jgi:hypothetical protein
VDRLQPGLVMGDIDGLGGRNATSGTAVLHNVVWIRADIPKRAERVLSPGGAGALRKAGIQKHDVSFV